MRYHRRRYIAGNIPIRLSYAALLRNVPSVASGGEQPALCSFGEHKKSYCKLLWAMFAGAVGNARERLGFPRSLIFWERVYCSPDRCAPVAAESAMMQLAKGARKNGRDDVRFFYCWLRPAVFAGTERKSFLPSAPGQSPHFA